MPNRRPHRRQQLTRLLKASLQQARSIAVIGIGSDLRGDDAAGLLVIRALRATARRPWPATIRLWEGGTAPENLTGEIRRFQPSHILLVDAADLSLPPGTLKLIAPQDICGLSFATHALPLSIMADYLKRSLKACVIILGLQPGRIDFGLPPSPAIQKAAQQAAAAIRQAVQPLDWPKAPQDPRPAAEGKGRNRRQPSTSPGTRDA